MPFGLNIFIGSNNKHKPYNVMPFGLNIFIGSNNKHKPYNVIVMPFMRYFEEQIRYFIIITKPVARSQQIITCCGMTGIMHNILIKSYVKF